MARLKFLVFALPALGLWAWHLVNNVPRTADVAIHSAEAVAASARPAFQARLAEERLRLQGLLAQGAAAWAGLPPASRAALKGEALNDAFTALRASLQTGVPDARKSAMVIALVGSGATLVSRGDAAAVESLDGLSLKEAVQAGPEGAIVEAFGTPHQFYALALTPAEKSGVSLVVGGPLISWELTDSVARETGLAAVGLAHAGKLLAAAGVQKAELKALVAARGKGFLGVRGAVDQLGPIALPWLGGDEPPPRFVAARSALPGTTLEVIGLATAEPAMKAIANAQRLGLLSLGILTVLGLAVLVLLRGAPAPAMSVTRPGGRRSAPEDTLPPKPAASDPLPVMAQEEPAEAHPDDFQFPEAAPPPVAESSEPGPFEGGLPPPVEASPWDSPDAPPVPPASLPQNPFAEEQPTTVAYPTYGDGGFSGYGDPAAQPGAEGDFNPDATRVATVPAELIQQSARQESGGASDWTQAGMPADMVAPPPIEPELNTDEAHFQSVFREFLATRDRCGESADGLTFDRFAQKLRKNREQLIQKYACRTVRFQVYVKEGKAALKATPVRD